ncbi:MAG TPA: hypothetical protein VFC67_10425 [Prolixibacteraceae bacterium]|nr:hypothetical protein [Prolixibacteraceae bacterium]
MSFSIQGKAQTENKNALLQMIKEDRTTVDAIAGYDEKIQSHILQVAQTPEVLSKIEELQNRSKNEFRSIINDYDRDAQAAFYDMARYPNLIAELVSNGKPTNSEVNSIVSKYPEDIHETTKKYARMYNDVLQRIDQLNSEIDRAFQSYLEPYNPQTRESVNALLAYPEIVSILVEDKDFTTLLGETYSEDPQWIIGNLNRISQELAEQNKEDLDAYKNQIQNDPEAYNEMLEASDKYAQENNEARYESSSDPIVNVRIINSYPYWFGYPYWYSDPYWRPLPTYYNTGFYRNNYGNVVFIGLPSYHFLHWQSYYHPTLFPHLSYNYYSYYENLYVNRYRNSNRSMPHNGFYRSIESNVINNPRVNNSTLERIDHQRGNNIVRRPNTMESGSARRGNAGVTQQRGYSNTRQKAGTSGTVNLRGNEQRSYERPGGTVNRRVYNTVNPGRSEGSTNRRGSGTGSGTIRRESSPASADPGRTSNLQQGTTTNRSYNGNPRLNQSGKVRVRENTSQSTNRATSSNNAGSRAASGRNGSQYERSSAPQRREASQSQRSAAPQQREASQRQRSTVSEQSNRSAQRVSRVSNSQSSSRSSAREKNSSSPSASAQNPQRDRGNRRQR